MRRYDAASHGACSRVSLPDRPRWPRPAALNNQITQGGPRHVRQSCVSTPHKSSAWDIREGDVITIEMMQQAGIPNELILKVKAIEEMERRAARREQNRINKRNQRLRQHVSADSADIADMNVEIAQENLSATASAETGTKIAQEESFLKTQKVRKKDSIGAHRIAVDWKPTEADRAWSLRYG